MNKYDKALEYEIFTKKEYGFADQYIQSAKLIFDVGGHIGLFSKYCLSLNPGCTIHYFEPIPALYNQAKQNTQNQNLILNDFGISSQTGQQNIYFNATKTMQSSKFNQTFLNPKGEQISVDMQNLEEYCAAKNIDSIDLLKIDTEGMEYEIIDSISDKFLSQIKTILVEFHCFNSDMEEQLKKMQVRLLKYFQISSYQNAYNKRLGYLLIVR